MALTKEQLVAYLRLPKFGTVKGFALGDYALNNNICLETPQDVLDYIQECREKNLARGIEEYDIDDIQKSLSNARRVIEMSEEKEIKLITYYDNDFPEKLRHISSKGKMSAPLLLWYRGNLDATKMPGIAIIGTREATPEGIKAGEWFGKKFAEAGFNIVSGLALGCDKSGHVGALNAKNGVTTAFLAHGLDSCYPPENAYLAEMIVERGGLLMSEYAIGTRGMASFFVERDRLQSGLSDACLVIQTGIKGGTLHAVRATVENRKPLFAVEYANSSLYFNPKVAGNAMLFNQGISYDNNAPLAKAERMSSSNVDEIIAKLLSNLSHTEENSKVESLPENLALSADGQTTIVW